jgi:uracil-DNA glycosylase family 4
MYRTGFANQPTSQHRDDGLELHGAYVCAVVRCAPPANKPTNEERDNCVPYLERELQLLSDVKAIVALGAFAADAVGKLVGLKRRVKFGHGAESMLPDGKTLICSYHPSQQNTFTGKLTQPMFDSVFQRAREIADGPDC